MACATNRAKDSGSAVGSNTGSVPVVGPMSDVVSGGSSMPGFELEATGEEELSSDRTAYVLAATSSAMVVTIATGADRTQSHQEQIKSAGGQLPKSDAAE